MSLRFDDNRRVLRLSVRDLVEKSQLHGHLNMEVVQTPVARLALGRMVHEQYQSEQEAIRPQFRRESTLKIQFQVLGWTVHLMGRVDGLVEESGVKVVEEVKSTAMDGFRLRGTDASDWTSYIQQVETYLWMLQETGFSSVSGRLILISVLDGTRHTFGVDLGFGTVDVRIRSQLTRLIEAREDRIRWMTRRRSVEVVEPFTPWRPGQADIAKSTVESLAEGIPLMVQAPTGLGKTAPILLGALSHVFATDRQVFWSTARTTQQSVAEKTAVAFQSKGVPVRTVTLVAKEKACLNDVVSCRPDHCPFAKQYYDKVHRARLLETAWEKPVMNRETLREIGETHEVCPYQLGLDLTETADVVVGDYNYAFDPERSVVFAQDPSEWVVVTDEAHQLVERARGYGSPALSVSLALEAADFLSAQDAQRFKPFIQLARDVVDGILDAGQSLEGPLKDGLAEIVLHRGRWRDLADRFDELAIDYVRIRAQATTLEPGERDPWLMLARSMLRFAQVMTSMGSETTAIVDITPANQGLKLFCLDPSLLVRARLNLFGGWVGCSATLSPADYYVDLFGLDPDAYRRLELPAFFPPDRRKILIASRVSTLYKDRAQHADRTAQLMLECVRSAPGNVAVYFPSFRMLEDITSRWDLPEDQLLAQTPNLSEGERVEWLTRLTNSPKPMVMAAVLGGIFAEGIDLPSGTLSMVLIAGPALPPVGLERDLLRDCYEERYGAGFQYASLIPGMTKVIQAAGRLLRSADDRGVIVLIGRRFVWRDYAGLLPDWWDAERPDDPAEAVADFWEAVQ